METIAIEAAAVQLLQKSGAAKHGVIDEFVCDFI
jgi:hypothetical protein